MRAFDTGLDPDVALAPYGEIGRLAGRRRQLTKRLEQIFGGGNRPLQGVGQDGDLGAKQVAGLRVFGQDSFVDQGAEQMVRRGRRQPGRPGQLFGRAVGLARGHEHEEPDCSRH
jgi:hypothetical protein